MSLHAYLPPSGAPDWVECPLWPTMNATFPETEPDQKALEGQCAHWALKLTMEGKLPMEGDADPAGTIIDEEMLEAVDVFIDAVEHLKGRKLHVEETVRGKVIHESLNWGTPDLWATNWEHDPEFKLTQQLELDVVDFKYGHEWVEVIGNWQLINYAALILENFGITHGNDPRAKLIKVNLTVVQPRTYTVEGPVRSWSLTAVELFDYVFQLRTAAERATIAKPFAQPGPHCKHCPGRHACPVLEAAAMSAIEQAKHVLPVVLPPLAVGIELRMLLRGQKLMEARISGLEAQALGLLRRGTAVPHFETEQTLGREVWAKPPEEIKALGRAMGVPLEKTAAFISPNAARKAGMPAEVVAAYADRPKQAIKLKESSNLKSMKVFGKKTLTPPVS